ncbi:MAG TPA: GlsB/YeaQ/YmgE family stress response membrane protein [Polyangiaceae bacterium]
MSIILFIVFGLIVGLLARALLPGRQKMGFAGTALLGMAGSFLGGLLGSLVSDHRVTDLHTAGVIGSVLGAILLLVLAGTFARRRSAI